MCSSNNHSQRMNIFEAMIVFAVVFIMMGSVLGTMLYFVWNFPSPWYLLGAVPATFLYWLFQRDSTIETLVIFVLLALFCWLARGPVQAARSYVEERMRSIAPVENRPANSQ